MSVDRIDTIDKALVFLEKFKHDVQSEINRAISEQDFPSLDLTTSPSNVIDLRDALDVILNAIPKDIPTGKFIPEEAVLKILDEKPGYHRFWENIEYMQNKIRQLNGITFDKSSGDET